MSFNNMVETKCYENIIPNKVIKKIVNFYNSRKDLHKKFTMMEKITDPWMHTKDWLDPFLSKIIDTRKNLGNDIYRHWYPYPPHVDSGFNTRSFNVLIPLKLSNPYGKQKFIVFDQFCSDWSNTLWMGNVWNYDKPKHFLDQEATFPDETGNVEGLTGKPIDKDFYDLHLHDDRFRNRRLFNGLNGTAYDFKPGNIIVFHSNRLHATGSMKCDWKLGINFRFEASEEI